MEKVEVTTALTALVVSVASFMISWRSTARADKAAAIAQLLGNKEMVAFASLRLLRDGLPRN